jgi:signal transduction histidine kinase
VTAEAQRRRAVWQILLLSAGFLVLVAISVTSVLLVNKARDASGLVVHTVEVESQLSNLLLEIRRAESATRAYLLTSAPQFLAEYETAAGNILPAADQLAKLTSDNPVQVKNYARLRRAIEQRLTEFARGIDRIKNKDVATSVTILRNGTSTDAVRAIAEAGRDMRAEEDRLFAMRTVDADRTQVLASSVTIAGSGLVIALAGLSIFLVRRSSRARDEAETNLRDNNLNLEATVDERTADLREANDEIQRFAYIVSHDLRSPLVNIMGFTSELEALRKDIFEQVGKLSAELISLNAQAAAVSTETEIGRLGEDFDEAIRFIKSSIGNMDRLINAVLKLSREGRRQFTPQRVDMKAMLEQIVQTVTHRAAEQGATVTVGDLPPVESDRLAIEQIFSNLVDNALKYGRPDEPLRIEISGRGTATHVIYDVRDNGRGIAAQDHQRVFELFRRAGAQDRPGEGIGLAHVRALVRRMGGNMGLNSELGKGSTFTVTLPRRWSVDSRSAA